MALTPSNMMPLGTQAPDFELLDTLSGKVKSLTDLKSDKATVIMFLCNHCPYVHHVQDALVALANQFMPLGASFIAISSNDAQKYPADGPIEMKKVAAEKGYPFVYLYDETQQVAKDYMAACTPDFYLFDGQMQCVYRGQLDSSRPGSPLPVTGQDLKDAINLTLSGEPTASMQSPSVGCNIKWK